MIDLIAIKQISCSLAVRVFLLVSILAGFSTAIAQDSPARILHINSYHPGYQWSDHIIQGIQSRLIAEDIQFDVVHLDSTQTENSWRFDGAFELAEKKVIAFKPDVVITSNDVAAKYVIGPLLKSYDMPVIFTGLHSDPDQYNFPKQKVTGIVELAMVDPLVDLLQQYSQGKRIGLLSVDSLSGRQIQDQYSNLLDSNFDQVYYARDFRLWKLYFNSLQDQVDLIILVDPTGLPGWQNDAALSFVKSAVRIPVGATDKWLAPLSLITIAKIPQEQGWWAADIAMKLVSGESPLNFPVSKTRDAKLFINFNIAEQLDIVFSSELIEIGSKVEN